MMAIFVLIRSGEVPGEAKPVCASNNPAVAAAALGAMLREVEAGVDSTPMLETLGILEPEDREPAQKER
jgi:hypothetical protein